jgi:hypothetical protein
MTLYVAKQDKALVKAAKKKLKLERGSMSAKFLEFLKEYLTKE